MCCPHTQRYLPHAIAQACVGPVTPQCSNFSRIGAIACLSLQMPLSTLLDCDGPPPSPCGQFGDCDVTDPVIRLHLGAHKTATTYLQHRLNSNRKHLADAGIAYWPTEDVRPVFKSAFERHKTQQSRSALRRLLRQREGRDTFTAQMEEWFEIDAPVILSEENLIGECNAFIEGGFYPEARDRLSVLAATLPERPVEIFLCLRAYPEFLASMYGEALRFWPMPSPEVFMAWHSDPAGKWPGVIDAIRAVFPDARITVWSYESFRTTEPQILAALCGDAAKTLAPLDAPEVRASASDTAIRKMASSPVNLSVAERVFRMQALEHAHPMRDRADRFTPWPEDERARLAAIYRDDLAQIAAREDITFLG